MSEPSSVRANLLGWAKKIGRACAGVLLVLGIGAVVLGMAVPGIVEERERITLSEPGSGAYRWVMVEFHASNLCFPHWPRRAQPWERARLLVVPLHGNPSEVGVPLAQVRGQQGLPAGTGDVVRDRLAAWWHDAAVAERVSEERSGALSHEFTIIERLVRAEDDLFPSRRDPVVCASSGLGRSAWPYDLPTDVTSEASDVLRAAFGGVEHEYATRARDGPHAGTYVCVELLILGSVAVYWYCRTRRGQQSVSDA